eukprot:Amastigsp_a99_392.p3 type:complete len:159 gc:universal Amastigsp_a99_392:869-393(-)
MAERLDDLCVRKGEDGRGALIDDVHARAGDNVHHGRVFDADDACADDNERARDHPVGAEHLVRVEDLALVEGDMAGARGARACCDEHLVGGDELGLFFVAGVGGRHRESVWALERTVARDHFDIVAVELLSDNVALALDNRGHVAQDVCGCELPIEPR